MVAQVDVRTMAGAAAGTVELDDAIFGIEPNVPVLHQVVTAQLAAARAGTQSTKTRAEVRLALRSALSDRAAEGRVAVVEAWEFDEPKTRRAREALGELGWEGKLLVVVAPDEEATIKSFRNLPDVQLLLVDELNAYDVLCNDWVVFTRATLPSVTNVEDA